MPRESFAAHWREIAAHFLKLGLTAYGGPAIMGIMQTEIQERRRWVSKERFVEGLSLANVLPGATATQLGIFLGHVRGGWWIGALKLMGAGAVVGMLWSRLRALPGVRALVGTI